MQFGTVPASQLNHIDCALPAEPFFNQRILKGKKVAQPNIYLGCSHWGSKEWVGTLYAPNTKEKDFLSQYVQYYNSVELNATHYKLYDADAIAKWSLKAGERDFLFCPKFYQGITHSGTLTGKDLLVGEFLNNIRAFGPHLGPLFLQLSEHFSPVRQQELLAFLASLPRDLSFFLELRHPDWWQHTSLTHAFFEQLQTMGIGAVITDTVGRRDCVHMYLTIPKVMIRFVGNHLHPTDYRRIDAWVLQLQQWLSQGLETVYFFLHMDDERLVPELAVYLVEQLQRVCGIALPKPVFTDPQQRLF